MALCRNCSRDNHPSATICATCGAPLGSVPHANSIGNWAPPAATAASAEASGFVDPDRPGKLGIPGKFVAAICYFPLCWCLPSIFSVVLLAVEDKENKFVRFHAMQSLGAWLGLFVFQIAAFVFQVVVTLVVSLSRSHSTRDTLTLLANLPVVLIGLAMVVALLVGTVMAAMGKVFRFPLLGAFAAKQAGL